MSRVLLFVQTGDARPKCAPTPRLLTDRDAQHVREMFESKPTAKSPTWMRVLGAADRWWLVECANADAGRRLLHAIQIGAATATDEPAIQPAGRILASGGKP